MQIIFYKTSSADNVVDKALTEVGSSDDFYFKNDIDVYAPSFEVAASSVSPDDFNYLYVQKLNRYYYVLNKTYKEEGLIELSCHCDVLMSFKSQFKNIKCVIERNENHENAYINSQYPTLVPERVQIKAFPNELSKTYSNVAVQMVYVTPIE